MQRASQRLSTRNQSSRESEQDLLAVQALAHRSTSVMFPRIQAPRQSRLRPLAVGVEDSRGLNNLRRVQPQSNIPLLVEGVKSSS
jgi:hypothetical protein